MDSSQLPGQDTSLKFADEVLAKINLDNAIQRISRQPTFLKREKADLEHLIRSAFRSAMPDFVAGEKHNPVFHHTQVLDNIVAIGVSEQLSYADLRRAAVLALLHDIGNAVSSRPKVKNSEIKDNIKRLREARDRQPQQVETLVSQLTKQARDAIAFRLEHMDRGPDRIDQIRGTLTGGITDEDIHYICRAVLVHDYPSIEQTLFELRREGIYTEHVPGQFLLPFDKSRVGLLLTLLREADRLFMVTKQGVVKDVLDKTAINEITPDKLEKKLASNAERHSEEFRLYRAASMDDWRFVSFTLYRTQAGFNLYRLLAQQRFDDGSTGTTA